jgi:hypothetical protein
VRLVFEQQGNHESQWAAIVSVAEKLGGTCTGAMTARSRPNASQRRLAPALGSVEAPRG